MNLEIYVGKSNINGPVATCSLSSLLETLVDVEVKDAVAQSLTVVRVLRIDESAPRYSDDRREELASEWYDAATEHEAGSDWHTIAGRLAAAVEVAAASTK